MIAISSIWVYLFIILMVISWGFILVLEIINLVIRKNLKTEAEDWQDRSISWLFIVFLPLSWLGPFPTSVLDIISLGLFVVIVLVFAIFKLLVTIERIQCLNRIISNSKKTINHYKEVRR